MNTLEILICSNNLILSPSFLPWDVQVLAQKLLSIN